MCPSKPHAFARDAGQDQELWDEKETASFLGIKSHTLACWRANKTNELRWLKLGRKIVRYRRADVMKWLAEQTAAPQKSERGQA